MPCTKDHLVGWLHSPFFPIDCFGRGPKRFLSSVFFWPVFHLWSLSNRQSCYATRLIVLDLNNIFLNWPWWPSGLSSHVSNSSRDRGLGPRFESPSRQKILRSQLHPWNTISIAQSQKWLVAIQIAGRRVALPLTISYSQKPTHIHTYSWYLITVCSIRFKYMAGTEPLNEDSSPPHYEARKSITAQDGG